MRDCFRWESDDGPTAYQNEILAAIEERRRVSARGPHGLGKTALLAWVVLHFALTRDAAGVEWKCPTTASAWRQLTKYLWPEIHKWARRLRWEKLGRDPFDERLELQTLNLKLRTGEAFAVASNNHELIEGAHADSLLYLFDESKAIPADTFDAAEGALSGSGGCEAFAVTASTPGEPQGRFYDIQRRKPGYEDWWVRAVTKAEVIEAGRMDRAWAEQRARQWGEQSAVYQNRVEGLFASSDEDGIVPLAWVEAANERWAEWVEADKPGKIVGVGVDVGRTGDKTVLAPRHEANVIGDLRRYAKADTMETTGHVAGVLTANPGAFAVVDVIGIGAGVYDRLREQRYSVSAFNASEHSDRRDSTGELGFSNVRSAAWWNAREMLDPASGFNVALPPDDTLTGDMTAPKWRVLSGGRIQVESKDELRKPARLGRSTDDGDAVVMVLFEDGLQAGALAASETLSPPTASRELARATAGYDENSGDGGYREMDL